VGCQAPSEIKVGDLGPCGPPVPPFMGTDPECRPWLRA